MRNLRPLFAFVMLLALAFSAFADTIRLKNGSIIKGRVTAFAAGKFTVTIGEGARQRTMTVAADEIESIEFDIRTVTATDARQSQPQDQRTSATTPRVVTTDSTPASQRTSQPVPPRNQPTPTINPAGTQPVPSRITKPVELTVKVLADNTSNGWTNSGWVVKKGQRIKITAEGEASIGKGITSTPAGQYTIEDKGKLMPNVPTAALIAVIGDDNNDFIYIGIENEFVAGRDGALFLGLNEGDLSDNSGSYTVKIEIFP